MTDRHAAPNPNPGVGLRFERRDSPPPPSIKVERSNADAVTKFAAEEGRQEGGEGGGVLHAF